MSDQVYRGITVSYEGYDVVVQTDFIKCQITATDTSFKHCTFTNCEFMDSIRSKFIFCDFKEKTNSRIRSKMYLCGARSHMRL